MIDYRTDSHGIVEFTIDGPITKPEYDRIVAEIDAAIERFGKLRMIEIVKDIGAIDSAIWWPDLKWAATHMKHIARCAVVTDKGWIGAITRAAAAVLPAEIRVFSLPDVAEARAWVRE
ncbi:STAS/SEC14 domain-containing protein [Hephaestia caeni]|nr:STAS/SEC14 domain-containing protein [Hephaestia caeni]